MGKQMIPSSIKKKMALLSNQEIKEQIFKMYPKKLDENEYKVYRWLMDELELRLTENDFDYFLDQLDRLDQKVA